MILTRWVDEEGEVHFTSPSGDYELTNLHPETVDCYHYGCVVHFPSPHRLSEAPYNWRQDRGIMERICQHGVGHPDADTLAFFHKIGQDWQGVHGCCGCC